MQNNSISPLVASGAFLVLAVVFLNPFHVLMTTMLHMSILALLVVAFGVFAVYASREQARDEREDAHRMLAGRAAFLAGAAVLLLGIVIQAFRGGVDAWLVIALCAMVLAKVIARFYGERER